MLAISLLSLMSHLQCGSVLVTQSEKVHVSDLDASQQQRLLLERLLLTCFADTYICFALTLG